MKRARHPQASLQRPCLVSGLLGLGPAAAQILVTSQVSSAARAVSPARLPCQTRNRHPGQRFSSQQRNHARTPSLWVRRRARRRHWTRGSSHQTSPPEPEVRCGSIGSRCRSWGEWRCVGARLRHRFNPQLPRQIAAWSCCGLGWRAAPQVGALPEIPSEPAEPRLPSTATRRLVAQRRGRGYFAGWCGRPAATWPQQRRRTFMPN